MCHRLHTSAMALRRAAGGAYEKISVSRWRGSESMLIAGGDAPRGFFDSAKAAGAGAGATWRLDDIARRRGTPATLRTKKTCRKAFEVSLLLAHPDQLLAGRLVGVICS